MNTLKKYIMATSALAVASLSFDLANAAPLASDNFTSYTSGTALEGLNGGTGFSAGYTTSSPSFGFLAEVRNGAPLSYPDYNDQSLGGNYANLAGGFGGPAYMDFRRTVDVAGAFSAYNDGTYVGLNNTTLYGSFAYNTANGVLNFLLQGPSDTFFALPTNGNANSLLVFKINFGTANADTITFFNNPTLAFDEGTASSTSQMGDFSFNRIGFAVNGDTFEGRVDNIRFGNTAADVISAVPEPSTYALLALGGMVVLFLRRRSSRLA